MSTQNVHDRAPARPRLEHPDRPATVAEPTPPVAEHDAPGFEPWLGILLAAFVPAIVAIYVPGLRTALFSLTGVLLVVGLVALVREERRRMARERR
jgi:hypothetical protein